MFKSKIQHFAKVSDIMNIQVNYGGEDFHFNLYEELSISEERRTRELKEQPSSYGFLSMLHKKLIKIKKEYEKDLNKCYASLYSSKKEKINPKTNRVYDKEYVHELVIMNKIYQAKLRRFLEAEHNVEILEVCVKSFEQRSNLLQTLSANERKNQS